MADIERTIRDLTIQMVESPTDRRMTMTIKFSVRLRAGPDGIDNYTIIVPRMIDRRIDSLLTNLQKIISDEDQVMRDLIVEKDVLTDLQTV